jgi:hypothetical protein
VEKHCSFFELPKTWCGNNLYKNKSSLKNKNPPALYTKAIVELVMTSYFRTNLVIHTSGSDSSSIGTTSAATTADFAATNRGPSPHLRRVHEQE